MTRAVIYCRISQDRTGAGLGVERQEHDCRRLAERLGWEIAEGIGHPQPNGVYVDNDISAYSGKPRPGYRAMLATLRGGQAGAVLCWHTDRLYRPSEWAMLEEYISLCQEHDIPTATVTAGTLDLTSATGKMNARITAAVNAAETERQIERMKAARVQKAQQGAWTGNKRPYGYESDGVTIRPAERDAVAWACGQILSGMSLRSTAAALNKRELHSSTGRPWDARTLGRMLRRPRNAGLSVHKGVIVGKAVWPALVPEVTWRGVVAVLDDPTRRTAPGGPPRWLGTNLYRCFCGALVVSKARGGPYKMAVYTCSASAHLSRNAAEVDAFVRDVAIAVMAERGRDLLVPEGAHERMAELHARDAVLAGKLRKLGDALADDRMDYLTVEQATAKIRTEREEITAELTQMAAGSVLSGVADAVDVAAAFDQADLSRRRAIVDLLMTVTLKRSRRGRPAGWEPGSSYFDPDSVVIESR